MCFPPPHATGSGHYFACIQAGVGLGGRPAVMEYEVLRTVPVCDSAEVGAATSRVVTKLERGSVVAADSSPPELRRSTSEDGRRRCLSLRTAIGWVTIESSTDSQKRIYCRQRAVWRLINDDEVEESAHPRKLEEGLRGPRASVLFYIRQDPDVLPT